MKLLLIFGLMLQVVYADIIVRKNLSWNPGSDLCKGCLLGGANEIYFPIKVPLRFELENVQLKLEGAHSRQADLKGAGERIFKGGSLVQSSKFKASGEWYQTFWVKVAEKLGYKLVDHKLELYGSKIKK